MALTDTFPVGIRNLNPGNLRQGYGMTYAAPIIDGFASFKTMIDGCTGLVKLLHDYYTVHNLTTLALVIPRFAPPSENDVPQYIYNVCNVLGWQLSEQHAQPLRLNDQLRMLMLCMAITRVEQGLPPAEYLTYPHWISISTWQYAMNTAGIWKGV